MVVGEEHQAVMRNDIGLVTVAREHHLPAYRLFRRRDRHLFSIIAHHQFARLRAQTTGPENQTNALPFEPLLFQTISQIVRETTNRGTRFVGIGSVMKANTSILT